MATTQIFESQTIFSNAVQVGGNASATITLPTQATECAIFVYRASLGVGGLYYIDTWGEVATIVAATGISITKSGAVITVQNNNNLAVRTSIIRYPQSLS